MKGSLIALGMKLVGFGGLWEKIDGMKTYLGASAEMLSGLAAVLASASELLKAFLLNVHSLGDAINFGSAIFNHPNASCLSLMAGWALVLHGWGVMAAKHSEDKRHAELLAAASPAVAPVAPVVEVAPAETPKA